MKVLPLLSILFLFGCDHKIGTWEVIFYEVKYCQPYQKECEIIEYYVPNKKNIQGKMIFEKEFFFLSINEMGKTKVQFRTDYKKINKNYFKLGEWFGASAIMKIKLEYKWFDTDWMLISIVANRGNGRRELVKIVLRK